MFKNNNGTAVKRLSQRSLKINKTRNIVSVLAIVLTTLMITSVFSIGISFAKNMKIMMTRLAGTTATIFLDEPDEKQYNKISVLDGVDTVGKQISVGAVAQKVANDKDASIAMLWYNKTEWEKHITPAIGDVKGNYPSSTNEIMLSEKALTQLGIKNPVLNSKITLTYRSGDGTYTKDFILSGWFKEFESAQTKGIALLSEQFCKENSLTLQENGKLCISCKKSSSSQVNKVYESIKSVAYENQHLSSGSLFQDESNQGIMVTVISIIVIALFIVLSGYLLIYNIMYISVSKDIHFYGLLKTIGTSPKQIKYIVRRQIYTLSAIGIPIGLILGLLLSFKVVPMAMSTLSSETSVMPTDISFNPLIFIGTAAFAFLTVVLSCNKPAKIASRVSPIEAVRYTGVQTKIKKKKRHSEHGGRLYSLAFHNVFRDRKRAVLVFTSLFMGIITFLSIFGFLSSLSVENFISKYSPNDFTYQSIPPLDEEKFDSAFMKQLSQIDGIKSKEIVRSEYCQIPFDEANLKSVLKSSYNEYFSSGEEGTYEDFVNSIKNLAAKNDYGTRIYSVDDKYVKEYNKTHDPKIDINAFNRGEVCLIGYGTYTDMIGKTLKLTSNTTKKTASVKIAGVFSNDSSCDYAKYAYTVGTIEGVFVSETFLNRLNQDAYVNFIMLNTEKSKEPAVKAQLAKLNKTLTNPAYDYEAKSAMAENFSSSIKTMTILTSGISMLLILIGMLNFINVMMTGVYTRLRELAVLESIGMTKKQIHRMLLWEGGYYALINALLLMTVGNVILFGVAKAVPKIADYATFNYPTVIILILLAVITVICLAVPPIVYKFSSHDSVTERLHNAEQ